VKGRLANLVLLVVVPLAALSGFWMFLVGGGGVWPVAVLHGALGLAVVALVPWKSVVVRRGLRRPPRPGRSTALLLTGVAVLAVLTGVAHRGGLLLDRLPLTTMQLHVATGVLAATLTLWHARERRVRLRRTDLSRRTLLRLGVVAAAAAALEAGARLGSAVGTPRGVRRATGSFRLASSSVAAIPVTSWLFDRTPHVDAAAWRLTVTGAEPSRQWSLSELTAWDDRVVAVLDCTGGWWTEQEWSGALVSRLLPDGATGSVAVTSSTGYTRRLPLTDTLLLATAVGGIPLSDGHGAPARLVVPGRRGYHWVKWVTRIEHDDSPWWEQPPLPLD
jgi:DMSO/TMAO reductase YedYZ molybdopterin-dependent catalytic subunit